MQRLNFLALHTSSICLHCRVRLPSPGNSTGYGVDLAHNLLILIRPLFFPNIPLLLFSIPVLASSQSQVSTSQFKGSEAFSISFQWEWELLIRFPTPFLGQEPRQLLISDKYFDLSLKHHVVLCRMPMVAMVFIKPTAIPLERIRPHLRWPFKGWVPLYDHKHFGEAGV